MLSLSRLMEQTHEPNFLEDTKTQAGITIKVEITVHCLVPPLKGYRGTMARVIVSRNRSRDETT